MQFYRTVMQCDHVDTMLHFEPWTDPRFVSFKTNMTDYLLELAIWVKEQVDLCANSARKGETPVYTTYEKAYPIITPLNSADNAAVLWVLQTANLLGGLGLDMGVPGGTLMTLSQRRHIACVVTLGEELVKSAEAIIRNGDYGKLTFTIRENKSTIDLINKSMGGMDLTVAYVSKLFNKSLTAQAQEEEG